MAMQVGASFIDIATPLSHRPDGHMQKECSHWCLPGAYDIGPQLLLNALMGHIGEPIGWLFFACGGRFASLRFHQWVALW